MTPGTPGSTVISYLHTPPHPFLSKDLCTQGHAEESEQAWEALLGGLAELCNGLATAVADGPALLEGLFQQEGVLQELLGLCTTGPALRLGLDIAVALGASSAAVECQTWWAIRSAPDHACCSVYPALPCFTGLPMNTPFWSISSCTA